MVNSRFCTRAITAVIVLVVLQGVAASAHTRKRFAEAKALFRAAYNASSIRAKGSPPFQLKASFQYEKWNSQVLRGSFTELWAAPNRTKTTFSVPAGSDINGVINKKTWHKSTWDKSTLSYSSFPEYLVDSAVEFDKALGSGPPTKLKRIKPEKVASGQRLTCVIPKHRGINEFCFNPPTHTLALEIDRVWGVTLQFSNYQDFGNKSFPREILVLQHSKLIAQIAVQKLVAIGRHIDPSAFAPPPGTKVENGLPFNFNCGPKKRVLRPIKTVPPRYPEGAKKAGIAGVVGLYADVGKKGQIRGLNVVHSVSPALDAAAIQAVKQWRYTPPTCGGVPVEVILPINVRFEL